jgi:hypothetical protein
MLAATVSRLTSTANPFSTRLDQSTKTSRGVDMSVVSEAVTELHPFDYRTMVADYRAAAWCEVHVDEASDAALLKSFHRIHEHFLRATSRNRPQLFSNVERSFFLETIRKWMTMYLRCVDEVRSRFPRTDDSTDLVALGRNWSERLGICYEGLGHLDFASRYAEYWAERSVTWMTTGARGKAVYETYDARMAFIGSEFYVLCDTLKRAKRVMIRDQARNGIPSFDIREAFRQLDDPADIEADCEQRDWHVHYIWPDARRALWDLARAGV